MKEVNIDAKSKHILAHYNGNPAVIGHFETLSSPAAARIAVDIKITHDLDEAEKLMLCQFLLSYFNGKGIRVEFPKINPDA